MLQALPDPHYVIAGMSGTSLAFSSWLQDGWHSSEMTKFRDGRRGSQGRMFIRIKIFVRSLSS